ncbi:MAG TPA: hypothetical protein VG734_18910 [Lacunisphaera sp.]|nr:hypothetical protein [Lacunisphaera sp.]
MITLLLVPMEGGLHRLICQYVIDERPPGSNDGTPAAIAEMHEIMKQVREFQAQRKAAAEK